jgi:hypothetical protein
VLPGAAPEHAAHVPHALASSRQGGSTSSSAL